MKTLFELQQDTLALYELLDEAGGEVSEETEAALDEFFTETGEAIEEKLEKYGWVLRNFQAEADAIKAEAERLAARARQKQKAHDALKARVMAFLQATDKQKIETRSFTFRRQKNGGKVPVIVGEFYVNNPVELPERFRKVEFKPDTEALREALSAAGSDEQLEALMYAELGSAGEHLRIK